MSKYKIIEVIKTSDKDSQSIYDVAGSLNDAITTLHNDFGVAVKQESTIGAYCLIIDNETGKSIEKFQWGESARDRVYTHNDFTDDNLTPYDSPKLAIGNYNTKIASQRNNTDCNFALTVRLDGAGNLAETNVWERPTA